MRAWQECHPTCGQIEPTWPWGNEQPQFSCFSTRAAVGSRNSSRVVARRQAGWVVTLFTVDGDSAWQLCVLFGGHAYLVAHGDISRHLYIHSYYGHAPQMSVGCQSPRTLFNVWPDPNQKQTLSLSVSSIYHRRWAILFSPSLYLPRHARSPRHELLWLPDVFLCSLLWSLGEKRSEYPICSFLWLFFGAAYCKPGVPGHTQAGKEE